MTDKITSLAELKKKLEDAIIDENIGWAYAQVLEFEASVREEDKLYKEALSKWGEGA